MKKNIEKFLGSFFRLFNASIEQFEDSNNSKKITGEISYKDNSGKQSFLWITPDTRFISDAIILLDFIISNKLAKGDKIIISRDKLIAKMNKNGWGNKRAKNVIDSLVKVEIFMIDDNERTDSFFIHF